MPVTERLDAFQRRHPVAGFPIGVIYKFGEDQGPYLAALITYYGFLSLFPLLLLLTSVLGFVLDGQPELQQHILDSTLSQFPVIGDELADPQGPAGQRRRDHRRRSRRPVRRARRRPGDPEHDVRHVVGAPQPPTEPDPGAAAQPAPHRRGRYRRRRHDHPVGRRVERRGVRRRRRRAGARSLRSWCRSWSTGGVRRDVQDLPARTRCAGATSSPERSSRRSSGSSCSSSAPSSSATW